MSGHDSLEEPIFNDGYCCPGLQCTQLSSKMITTLSLGTCSVFVVLQGRHEIISLL